MYGGDWQGDASSGPVVYPPSYGDPAHALDSLPDEPPRGNTETDWASPDPYSLDPDGMENVPDKSPGPLGPLPPPPPSQSSSLSVSDAAEKLEEAPPVIPGQCKRVGCSRPPHADHECCGRSCAKMVCARRGCTRTPYPESPYCCWSCRQVFSRPMLPVRSGGTYCLPSDLVLCTATSTGQAVCPSPVWETLGAQLDSPFPLMRCAGA